MAVTTAPSSVQRIQYRAGYPAKLKQRAVDESVDVDGDGQPA